MKSILTRKVYQQVALAISNILLIATVGISYSTVIEARGPLHKNHDEKENESTHPSVESHYELVVDQNEIKVMSYNVENLFDTVHDNGKNDATFLPAGSAEKKKLCPQSRSKYYQQECFHTDWSDEKLKVKLQQIRQAVFATGSAPDILSISEVENENVLSQLAQALGYKKYYITNGPDERGIDVAILWKEDKLKLLKTGEIDIQSATGRATRPILKAQFETQNKGLLNVYVNHWPSQASPSKARYQVASILEADIEKTTDQAAVLALGDFNTLDEEKPNGIQDVLTKSLEDVHLLVMQGDHPAKDNMPPGTYFFMKNHEWNRLDRVMASHNLFDGKDMELSLSSFRIVAPDFMTYPHNGQRIPKRYNFDTKKPEDAGFSDHLPLAFKIRLP